MRTRVQERWAMKERGTELLSNAGWSAGVLGNAGEESRDTGCRRDERRGARLCRT